MKPGASASWRSNTLRFTMMIVSIVGGRDWAVRWSGERAASNPSPMPTALLDQVNALVQRIGGVSGGVVPFRKIQRRVHPARDLAQAARGEPEAAPHRVGFEWLTETGDGGIGGGWGGRGGGRGRRRLCPEPRAAPGAS